MPAHGTAGRFTACLVLLRRGCARCFHARSGLPGGVLGGLILSFGFQASSLRACGGGTGSFGTRGFGTGSFGTGRFETGGFSARGFDSRRLTPRGLNPSGFLTKRRLAIRLGAGCGHAIGFSPRCLGTLRLLPRGGLTFGIQAFDFFARSQDALFGFAPRGFGAQGFLPGRGLAGSFQSLGFQAHSSRARSFPLSSLGPRGGFPYRCFPCCYFSCRCFSRRCLTCCCVTNRNITRSRLLTGLFLALGFLPQGSLSRGLLLLDIASGRLCAQGFLSRHFQTVGFHAHRFTLGCKLPLFVLALGFLPCCFDAR